MLFLLISAKNLGFKKKKTKGFAENRIICKIEKSVKHRWFYAFFCNFTHRNKNN